MKKIFVIASALLLSGASFAVMAQTAGESQTADPISFINGSVDNLPSVISSDGVESCFDSYPYGQVSFIDSRTDKGYYQPGDAVIATGVLSNRSSVPVSDAAIFTQLYYVVKNLDGSITSHLIDATKAFDNIFVGANDQSQFLYEYSLPEWLPAGIYRLASFLVVSEQYNLAGLSFAPDIYGDLQSFKIQSEQSFDLPYFDINKSIVGGKLYSRDLPSLAVEESPVLVQMPLLNPGTNAKTVEVIKKLYHWDDIATKNFISEEKQVLNLDAGGQKLIPFTTQQLDGGTYMVTFTAIDVDGGQTISRVRFSIPGNRVRLIYSGLSNIPSTKDEQASITTCFANETNLSNEDIGNNIKVTLFDKSGDSLSSFSREVSAFSSDVGSWVEDFQYGGDKQQDLTLVVQLYQGNKLLDEVRTYYPAPKNYLIIILVGVAILLLGLVYVLYKRRRFSGATTISLLLLISVSLLLGGSSVAQAASDSFTFRARIGGAAQATFGINTSIDLFSPDGLWYPGNSYFLDYDRTAEYNAIGGSFDSPPMNYANTELYSRRSLQYSLQPLGNFIEEETYNYFVDATYGSFEMSGTPQKCLRDNSGNRYCMGIARRVSTGTYHPVLLTRSYNWDNAYVRFWPSVIATSPDNFYLDIRLSKSDELIADNLVNDDLGVICSPENFRCEVSPTARPGNVVITWRMTLGAATHNYKIMYYGRSAISGALGYWYLADFGADIVPQEGNLPRVLETSTVITIANANPAPPGAPFLQGINIEPWAPCGGSVYLSWSAPTSGGAIEGYRVFRDGRQITTTGQTNYLDSGLTSDTIYSYVVRAYNSVGNSMPSNTVTILASGNCVSGPPSGGGGGVGGLEAINVAPEANCETIYLRWPAYSASEGYRIFRETSRAPATQIGAIGPLQNPGFLDDTGLNPRTLYRYFIEAFNSFGVTRSNTTPYTSPSVDNCGVRPPDGGNGGGGGGASSTQPDIRETNP
ncbi:MAG: fibronectin type III domain-containing protein [bacterium]|nr:fibronectin type III domain-containing protein [bacterium]